MNTLAEAEQNGAKAGLARRPSRQTRRRDPEDPRRRSGHRWLVPARRPGKVFAEGRQNDVPVLLGSNKDEGTFFAQPTTAAKYVEGIHRRYGDLADQYLKIYPGATDEEANDSQLRAFRDELGWVMRNWASLQSKTGKSKAYLYYFTHEPPAGERRLAARRPWLRRDARRRSRLRLREPAPAAPVDRSRSPGCRHALFLLGQLRDQRKPQRQRTSRVARVR